MPIKRLRFHIHGTTPETCPMDRLLDYLKKLGLTMGSKEHVHLLDVTDGSLSPVIGVEEQEFPLVKARIGDAAKGLAQREANNAFKDLMDQLEEDQYKAELFDEEADEIIQDFSRLKEEETFGPFWQQGILYGYLRRLEGSDKTDHATLLYDGGQCVCEMSESIGHRLAPFYRMTIRVYGKGRWYRNRDGKWELLRFVVDDFEALDDTTLFEVVKRLRAIPNNALLKLDDPLAEMQKIRDGEY